MGFRVLLIDADPQANLTDWLGVRTIEEDGGVREIELEDTLFPAILGDDDTELALPKPIRIHGMDLIPSHLDVATIEPLLPGQLMGVLRLKDALRPLAPRYDFVLIDPPPSLGQLSALSVIAADHVVVPVPASGKGLKGPADGSCDARTLPQGQSCAEARADPGHPVQRHHQPQPGKSGHAA